MKALLNPWVIVGFLVWTGLIGGGSYFYGHHNGANSIQTKWDADRLATANEVARLTLETAAKEAKARAINAKERKNREQTIADINADRDSLSQRLRDYEAEILRASGGEIAGGLGPDAIARIASGQAEVARRYDDYDKACQRDAVRFADVQAVIRRFQAAQDAVAK